MLSRFKRSCGVPLTIRDFVRCGCRFASRVQVKNARYLGRQLRLRVLGDKCHFAN
jgi:hypothetical protein